MKFVTVPSDDIYRSALLNASLFAYPEYKTIGYVSLLEAMTARCQLVIRSQPLFSDLVKNGENSYTASYSETLTSIIVDSMENKIKNLSEFAHKEAEQFSLETIGEKLKWFYQQTINLKNGD
jgi:1,2-diacylglycerol-3-alpha-glucose alpha-1,2-glucosyltransferase